MDIHGSPRIFDDFHRFSLIFADFRRFSQIFADFHRFSQIFQIFVQVRKVAENCEKQLFTFFGLLPTYIGVSGSLSCLANDRSWRDLSIPIKKSWFHAMWLGIRQFLCSMYESHGLGIENLSKIYRKSIEHLSKIYRTSIEHLSNIYRNVIENLSHIYRTSIEHL